VHALNRLFDPHQAPARLEEHLYFGDIVLKGDAALGDVAEVYGVEVPPEHLGKTLAQYLDQRSRGRVVVGDRAPLGNALLVVRDIEDGRVTEVGLKLR
jgi:potassium/hydrogen antiporter